jgi:alpha-galactosidase
MIMNWLKRIPNGVWSVGGSRADLLSVVPAVALFVVVLLVQVAAHATFAPSGQINYVNPAEKTEVDRWVMARLQETRRNGPPFSFVFDGEPSGKLLKTWKRELSTKRIDENRTEYRLSYSCPRTGLVVRCVAIRHHDFPTVDWTVTLRNTGTADTPIIERVQAMDDWFERDARGEFMLHHCAGALSSELDYGPRATRLDPNASIRLAPVGGRSTNHAWPYFNLQYGGR